MPPKKKTPARYIVIMNNAVVIGQPTNLKEAQEAACHEADIDRDSEFTVARIDFNINVTTEITPAHGDA